MGNICRGFSRRPTNSVHPHTRGEHASGVITRLSATGSSPHTWGTCQPHRDGFGCHRFIPTHVGNISMRVFIRSLNPVHPHTRGEHRSSTAFNPLLPGSSPHTWGTYPCCRPGPSLRRFIPTHVGNISRWSGSGPAPPVHPHTRGEHLGLVIFFQPIAGSSPHTWGTSVTPASRGRSRRFIPTHVGNIDGWAWATPLSPVHPHTRGEHPTSGSKINTDNGSSPHTWGTYGIRMV